MPPGPARWLGTGIVGVFQRGPALLAQQAAALTDASSGRFALGIGASSDRMVEGWNQIPFVKPLSKVEQTVDFLRVASPGSAPTPASSWRRPRTHETPIVLAALRGKMLELAVNRRRLHQLPAPWPACRRWSTASRAPATTSSCFAVSSASPVKGNRSRASPGSCSPATSRCRFTRTSSAGSATAKRSKRWSSTGTTRTARPAAAAAPWELIEDTFLLGSPEQIRARLDEYVAGGITLPVITPVTTPDNHAAMIKALAP